MNSTSSPKSLKPDHSESVRVFWLMYALAVLSWISIKMILPALPGLADVLNTNSSGIKLSVSIYLIFFALSQLVWGVIIQKRGSRRTIYYSLTITLLGTLIAMISFDLPLYMVGRTLEGIGMGALGPVTRTVLVNYFDHKALSVRLSIIIGTAATMPALAPLFAGYLLIWISWQAIFAVFFMITAILFYFIYRLLPSPLHETIDYEAFSMVKILQNYLAIVKQKVFWGYTLPYAAITGGLLGYYSAMPYWYHVQLHIAEQHFSYLVFPTVGMYVSGLLVSRWLIRTKTIEMIIVYGTVFAFSAACLAFALAALNINALIDIVIVMSLFGFSAGLISPNANAGVLAYFKQVAAPTSALVTMTVFSSAALISAITMNIHINETLWALAAYLGTLSVIALLAGYFWMWLPSQKRDSYYHTKQLREGESKER